MIAIDKDIPLPPKKGGFGQPRKYPWNEMEIGDSFVLMAKNMPCASAGASTTGKRLGFRFTVRRENGGGFRVWRIA